MKLSLIVLAWNDADDTARCLASAHQPGVDVELILVDNGSEPAIAGALADLAQREGAVLARSEINLGYAGGMNVGLAASTGEAVVLSNNDVEYAPGSLAALVRALERPRVGLVVPTIVDPLGRPAPTEAPLPTNTRLLARIALSEHRLRLNPDWTWHQGPVVAMRTSTLRALGGVPTHAFMYSEDMRLCASVRAAGLLLHVAEDSVVSHVDDASATRLWSAPRIAREQTREHSRAARDILGGVRGRLYTVLALIAALQRALLAPNRHRWNVVRGTVEGLRP